MLSDRIDRRARTVLDTLLPSHSNSLLPYGVLDAGFDTFYQEFERMAHPLLRGSFKVALWVAVWVSPLLIGRVPPVNRYERATRERALRALAESPFPLFRQLVIILKMVTCFCYGANGQVRNAIGYPVEPTGPQR